MRVERVITNVPRLAALVYAPESRAYDDQQEPRNNRMRQRPTIKYSTTSVNLTTDCLQHILIIPVHQPN